MMSTGLVRNLLEVWSSAKLSLALDHQNMFLIDVKIRLLSALPITVFAPR